MADNHGRISGQMYGLGDGRTQAAESTFRHGGDRAYFAAPGTRLVDAGLGRQSLGLTGGASTSKRVSFRRNPVLAVCALASLVATLIACSDDSTPPIGTHGEYLLNAALPCDGDLHQLPAVRFENSGKVVYPYFCAPVTGAPTVLYTDSEGTLLEPAALEDHRRADRAAAVENNGRLAQGLRSFLANVPPTRAVPIDIWFPGPKRPDKTTMLELDDESRKRVLQSLSDQMQGSAEAIWAGIRGLASDLRVLSTPSDREFPVPVLRVEAPARLVNRIGEVSGVDIVELALNEESDTPTGSEAYYDIDTIPLFPSGTPYGGAGIRVVDILGSSGVGNTSQLALESGSCVPNTGPSYDCFCPSAASGASAGGHMQDVLGIIKNTHPNLRKGIARSAKTIVGNASSQCSGDVYDWALSRGASVINRSATNWTSAGKYLDYLATNWPYPLVVGAAGNDPNSTVGSRIRNGLVVGGADDEGDPDRTHLDKMYSNSSWINPGSNPTGWELPHVVAPARSIYTVPSNGGSSLKSVTGTSFATPQVSGIGAILQSAVPALKV